MHWLALPDPSTDSLPAFRDPADAASWLAALAGTPADEALIALREQIAALDCAGFAAPQTVALLNLLRSTMVPLQAAHAASYTRQPLPLASAEEQSFTTAHTAWTQLGIAYLRVVPNCTPANKALPLLRAASAFRLAQYCHFLAARTCPPLLDQLLVNVLATAAANDVLHKAVIDPDYPRQGKGSIGGQVAWAFVLRAIDPYHLTATQLRIANSACGRWRELVSIKSGAVDWQKSYVVDLSALIGHVLPAGSPCWLDIRGVARKIGKRIDALKAGESPEALNMGRELSAAAAIRLLVDLEQHLHPTETAVPGSAHAIELEFGSEKAYAVLANRPLNVTSNEDFESRSQIYRRMELLGFERIAPLPTAVKKRLAVPGERWVIAQGTVTRAAQTETTRLRSPCLVAAVVKNLPKLGTLTSLRCADDGTMTGHLTWYGGTIEAGSLKRLAPLGDKLVRVPVFLLKRHGQVSVILPPDSGTRLGVGLDLTETSIAQVIPVEVLERGTDFVHYACQSK